MTELNGSPSLRLKVQAFDRGRQLVVTLWASFLEVRPLGKRRGYAISYDSILRAAAEIEVRKQRAEREIQQKEKRRERRK